MRIAHVITRLILGGAQENTLLCCEDLLRDYGDDVLLVTGPPLGPEGELAATGQGQGGCRWKSSPSCAGRSIRGAIWLSYRRIKQILRGFRPDVVHTHSAKAASWAARPPARSACRRSSTRSTARRFIRTRAGGPGRCSAACERWAAARCHALGQRGRRHDRPDGRRRRRAAREVHHDLQRHGGRAVPGRRPSTASGSGANWATGRNTSWSARSPGCFTSKDTRT